MPACKNSDCDAFAPDYEVPYECDACGIFFPELRFRDD